MKKKKITMKRILSVCILSALFLFGSTAVFGQVEGEKDELKKPSKYDQKDDVFEEKRTVDEKAETMSTAKAPANKMAVDDMSEMEYNKKYWSKKYEEREIPVKSEMQTMKDDEKELGEAQMKKEQMLEEIYGIVMDYPQFTYEYEYGPEGELQDVEIEGVPDTEPHDELAVLLVDLHHLNKQLMNKPMPTGAFYVTEDEAEPKQGYEDFFNNLYSNLNYPEEAEDRGVEGTMYVKFIVNDDGNINNLQVDHDIETPYTQALEAMKESAKEAVQATSGNWEPATVNGEKVSEFVVVPVKFDFEVNPTLKAPIR